MQQRIHRQQEGSLIYYTSDNITTKHLFTTKFGGVSKGYLASLNLGFNRGDERSNVLQNYQILADHFRVPRARMTMTKQIHSDIVRVVDENTMGMGLGQPMSWKANPSRRLFSRAARNFSSICRESTENSWSAAGCEIS